MSLYSTKQIKETIKALATLPIDTNHYYVINEALTRYLKDSEATTNEPDCCIGNEPVKLTKGVLKELNQCFDTLKLYADILSLCDDFVMYKNPTKMLSIELASAGSCKTIDIPVWLAAFIRDKISDLQCELNEYICGITISGVSKDMPSEFTEEGEETND